MPVVVGKAARSHTPILGGEISYLVFRPYWYVPRSIVVKEMLPAYRKDPGYFDKKELELTATSDDAKPGLPATPENVEKLRAGSLGVRQKPGPRNALGKVKFIFPNGDSVYLHDTPAKSFFGRERRDFSHGCVRVSDPPALAAFLLRSTSGWDAAAIAAAMDAERPQVVYLKPKVPVWLLYTTAAASTDGTLAFWEDVYRRARPEGGPAREALTTSRVLLRGAAGGAPRDAAFGGRTNESGSLRKWAKTCLRTPKSSSFVISNARAAFTSESVKATVRFRTNMTAMPPSARRNQPPRNHRSPRPAAASASVPVESVTCRTSNGIPKKRPTAGAKPSRNPSATFVPQPAALRLSASPRPPRRSFVKSAARLLLRESPRAAGGPSPSSRTSRPRRSPSRGGRP